jgi:hypothetical protein|tara:strand:+ start:552 stop:803 length:252 start_codon:yes stop_codon:yes gene_type:complete
MAWQEVHITRDTVHAYVPDKEDTQIKELTLTQAQHILYMLGQVLHERGEKVCEENLPDDEEKTFEYFSTPELWEFYRIFNRID